MEHGLEVDETELVDLIKRAAVFTKLREDGLDNLDIYTQSVGDISRKLRRLTDIEILDAYDGDLDLFLEYIITLNV